MSDSLIGTREDGFIGVELLKPGFESIKGGFMWKNHGMFNMKIKFVYRVKKIILILSFFLSKY